MSEKVRENEKRSNILNVDFSAFFEIFSTLLIFI